MLDDGGRLCDYPPRSNAREGLAGVRKLHQENAMPEPIEPRNSSLAKILHTHTAVAEALSLSEYWLEEAARKRLVDHTRVGRRLLFTREQIEALVSSHTVSAYTPGEFLPKLPKRPSATGQAAENEAPTRLKNLRPKKSRHAA
ncbi:hypothetical protein [Nocardia sp. NPDC051570]|uniref:hypothetical protein n=1 Tax=Nocardia sp. NPDC051570 TaxID=3364324 RepID=UPI0037BBB299